MIRHDEPRVRVDRIERAGTSAGTVVALVLGLLLLSLLAVWAIAQAGDWSFGQSATSVCQQMTC